MSTTRKTCPDCGVTAGKLHEAGCDVERCAECGGQALMCDGECKRSTRLPWTGVWPGTDECVEFGWYAKFTEEGWTQTTKDDPEGSPDYNRLHVDAKWDKELKRFVRR